MYLLFRIPNSNTKMTYGTKLRKIREKNKLSQQEIADQLQISQSTYSQWESDLTTFKVEYLPKLAEIFKIDVTELIVEGTVVKVMNNQEHKNNEYSVVGFEINMDVRDLYHKLLLSKDEIIQSKNEIIEIRKQEIEKLRAIIQELKQI